MNRFTNCTAPTSVFPAIGTSLTDTSIGDGGAMTPSSCWAWVGQPCRPQKLQKKKFENSGPSEGPGLLTGVGWTQDPSFVLSHRCNLTQEEPALSTAPASTSGCADPEGCQGQEPDQRTLEGPWWLCTGPDSSGGAFVRFRAEWRSRPSSPENTRPLS